MVHPFGVVVAVGRRAEGSAAGRRGMNHDDVTVGNAGGCFAESLIDASANQFKLQGSANACGSAVMSATKSPAWSVSSILHAIRVTVPVMVAVTIVSIFIACVFVVGGGAG